MQFQITSGCPSSFYSVTYTIYWRLNRCRLQAAGLALPELVLPLLSRCHLHRFVFHRFMRWRHIHQSTGRHYQSSRQYSGLPITSSGLFCPYQPPRYRLINNSCAVTISPIITYRITITKINDWQPAYSIYLW